MPRAERPLDAEDTELGSFAADLRRLRDKAGKPSYRELGSRAHYSAATLSDAAGGRKLPSLAVVLAYVKACGGDPDEWEQRWRAIAAPPEQAGESPYVGLNSFQAEDADRFFGREKLTAKLKDLVCSGDFATVRTGCATGSARTRSASSTTHRRSGRCAPTWRRSSVDCAGNRGSGCPTRSGRVTSPAWTGWRCAEPWVVMRPPPTATPAPVRGESTGPSPLVDVRANGLFTVIRWQLNKVL